MANATPKKSVSGDAKLASDVTSETAATAKPEAKTQAAAEPAKAPAHADKPVAKAPVKRTAKKTTGQSTKARKPSPPRKYSGAKTMTAAKDTAKDTLETMTAASNEAIKDGFEKSLSAVNHFSAFQKDTVDAVIASSTTAAKSLEELNAATLAYAKKSMEDGVAAAKCMASAKSVQELIEIQSDYTKSSLDGFLAEMNKNSDLMSAMFKDSFKPLNARFSAAVELMQSQR